MAIFVPGALILILCMVLLTLVLGLPLLLKPDSLVPDIIAFGILGVAVLAFVWGTGAYWIAIPILALVAFVAWLDREGQNVPATLSNEGEDGRRDGPGGGATGANRRTGLPLRLWRTALVVQTALVACALILPAAGFIGFVELILPWMVITMVAMAAFRYSFYRSCTRAPLTGGDAAA